MKSKLYFNDNHRLTVEESGARLEEKQSGNLIAIQMLNGNLILAEGRKSIPQSGMQLINEMWNDYKTV